MIPARDYVNYVMDAVGKGYVYGSSGQICTPQFRQDCAKANPSQKTNILTTAAKWDGIRVWDCSGIMRGAWRTLLKYRSGFTTKIFDEWCTRKGRIENMPDMPGTFVFTGELGDFPHIGTYVGNNKVVDARGTAYGVLYRDIDNVEWTYWAQADDIDFLNITPSIDDQPALWSGIVKTRTGHGISLWSKNDKTVKLADVPEGATVEVLEDADEKGFAKCRHQHKMGKADMQYVFPKDGEEAPFETTRAMVFGVNIGLNLRTDPSYKQNTIVLLPNDAVVEVFETKKEFSRVRYENNVGWVTSSYLRPVEGGVN